MVTNKMQIELIISLDQCLKNIVVSTSNMYISHCAISVKRITFSYNRHENFVQSIEVIFISWSYLGVG